MNDQTNGQQGWQQPVYQQPDCPPPGYQQPVYQYPAPAATKKWSKGTVALLVVVILLFVTALAIAVAILLESIGILSNFNSNRNEDRHWDETMEEKFEYDQPDDPYYDVKAHCDALAEQGDLLGAVLYLQEAVADETDSRYAELLTQCENDLVNHTLAEADAQINEGQYRLAVQTLYRVQQSYDCQAFVDAATEYKKLLGRHSIAAGLRYSAAVNDDGTVKIAGTPKAERTPADVSSWTDVISVATGDSHIIGLRADGTVLGTGPAEYHYAVTGWTDIVAIAAGDTHSVGLKADGTVVAIGENFKGECNVQGLYSDSPIVAIAAGYEFTVALHLDGTVTTVGGNTNGQCNVSGWRDIESIAAGTSHTLGVTADGRVVAAGSNAEGQCNVGAWSGIAAVSAGDYFTMGLRHDGTVVAVGMNGSGQCNVGSWRNIVDIAGGNYQALGRDAYGDLVSVGGNQVKQRDFTN